MADYVTYEVAALKTQDNKVMKITHPILTISHIPVISKDHRRHRTCKSTYTVRGFLSLPIKSENISWSVKEWLDDARRIFSRGQGKFTWHKSGTDIKLDPKNSVADGPHPTSINIERLHGKQLASIVWQFDIEQFMDPSMSQSGNDAAVLDFTYTIVTSMDITFTQTRRIAGILRLNSADPKVTNHSADCFRETIDLYACSTPNKANEIWQRISAEYRVTDDHRAIIFTFTDIQKYAPLPPGIVAGDLSIGTGYRKKEINDYTYELSGWYQAGVGVTRRTVLSNAATTILDFFNLIEVQFRATFGSQPYPQETLDAGLEFKVNHLEVIACNVQSSNNSNRVDFSATVVLDVARYYQKTVSGPWIEQAIEGPDEIGYSTWWLQVSIGWAYYALTQGKEIFSRNFRRDPSFMKTAAATRYPAYGQKNARQANDSWRGHGHNNAVFSEVVGYCGNERVQGVLIFERDEPRLPSTEASNANTGISKKVPTSAAAGVIGNANGTGSTSGSGGSTRAIPTGAPHVTWRQSFKYVVDRGKLFVPVLGAGAPVEQTLHSPYTILTITGEASRKRLPPRVAVPPYKLTHEGGGATILKQEIQTNSPTVQGLFVTSWLYIVQLNNVDSSTIPEPTDWKYYRTPYTQRVAPINGWKYENPGDKTASPTRGYLEEQLDKVMRGEIT